MGFTVGSGQNPNPAIGRIFTETEIPKVKIFMDTDSLEDLYLEENWYNNHEYPATFVWEDTQGSDTLHDIGFRFRGNTSRDKFKKSFKVSFNTYISGRRYNGLKKLNLNAETNDPSMLRSHTAWKMYRDHGIPASRSNHVEVHINGEYYGLYQNCEHINDDWAEARFGDDAGNLYKCSYPADLNYVGSDPDSYIIIHPWSDTRVYDLKTNEEQDDYTGLASFIDYMEHAGDEDFACRFQEYFNVWEYLKIAAIDVLTGNWDGYIWNVNNYYLYDNPLTGRFEYLPYDLDNTWGVTWPGIDWAGRNVYEYSHDDHDRILYDRLMETPVYRDVFSYYLREMGQHYVMNPDFSSYLETVQGMIGSSAMADTYRPLDFGYSEPDFWNALHDPLGGHVQFGLIEFAETRVANNSGQVEDIEIAPIIYEMQEDFSNFPEELWVRVRAEGPQWESLVLTYRIDDGEEMSLSANVFDPSMNFNIQLEPGSQKLTYNLTATGSTDLQRRAYCEPRNVYYGAGVPKIFINEVMSSNSMTIADEHGDFDDWIEIYNGGDVAVNLTGYYLVDKASAPKYWATPATTMEPGDFRLFWADGEPEQGPMHTNFGVSEEGEGIYLFQRRPDGIRVIDLVKVPALPTDASWGRQSDGSLPWSLFDSTTPNASNSTVGTDDNFTTRLPKPYPNPVSGELRWDLEAPYTLYDLAGRPVQSGRGEALNMEPFASGLYMLRVGKAMHKVIRD